MFLTDRGAARLVSTTANAAAAVFGFGGAWLTGFSPWAILAAPVAGTIGWFVGWAAGRRTGRALTRTGYAPAGRAVYRLGELPPAARPGHCRGWSGPVCRCPAGSSCCRAPSTPAR